MKTYRRKKKVSEWIGRTATYYNGRRIKIISDDKKSVECNESGFDFDSVVVISKKAFSALKDS